MRATTSRFRLLASALVVVGLAAGALAGEILKLKNGDLLPGTVLEHDEQGVTFQPEKGGKLVVPWERVYPSNRYELVESTLAADDAPGRVALAKWALDAELFHQARKGLLQAKGLGFEDTDALNALIESVDQRQADRAIESIDGLVEQGELDDALDKLRTFVRRAPPGEQSDRVRAKLPDLLSRIERRDAVEEEVAESRVQAAKRARRERWLETNFEKAEELKAKAVENAIAGYANLAGGNQTRARKGLTKAEKGYQDARKLFRKLKKTLGADPRAEICDREIDDCDRRTLEVLVRWGGLEVRNRSWKRASAIVDRGLRLDPVHSELLDMRETIDENWIRRRASDISNAKPR